MTIRFSPDTPYDAGILEFEDVDFVVSVTDESPGSPAGVIPAVPATSTPVGIVSVDIPDSGITVYLANNTFRVTGQFVDVFDKTLTFRDRVNTIDRVHKFEDIPEDYNALFQYLAPKVQVKNVTAKVVLGNHIVYDYDIVVHHNFVKANNDLKSKVSRGKF